MKKKLLIILSSILLVLSIGSLVYVFVINNQLKNDTNKLNEDIKLLENNLLSNDEKEKELNEDYTKLQETSKTKLERLESWKKLKEKLGSL